MCQKDACGGFSDSLTAGIPALAFGGALHLEPDPKREDGLLSALAFGGALHLEPDPEREDGRLPALAFGGAFNPPTVAHIELAHYAMTAVGAKCVIFIPSKSSYVLHDQKKSFSFTDAERLEMLRRIAQSRPWMRVSSYEIEAARQPRTYETLCQLREEGYAPRLLVGSDKLPELAHVWRHVDEMCREFGIVCLSRGGDDAARMIQEDSYLRARSAFITAVDAPTQYRAVSSTRVRELIEALRGQQEGGSNPKPKGSPELSEVLCVRQDPPGLRGDVAAKTDPAALRMELRSLVCEELKGLEEWL